MQKIETLERYAEEGRLYSRHKEKIKKEIKRKERLRQRLKFEIEKLKALQEKIY